MFDETWFSGSLSVLSMSARSETVSLFRCSGANGPKAQREVRDTHRIRNQRRRRGMQVEIPAIYSMVPFAHPPLVPVRFLPEIPHGLFSRGGRKF